VNWLDIVIIFVLVVSVAAGSSQGALRTLYSLASFLVAVFVAGRFYQPVGDVLRMFVDSTLWGELLGFGVVFVIVSAVMDAFGRRLLTSERVPKGGSLSRLAGAILGLAQGALGLQLFILIFIKFPVFDFLTAAIAGSQIVPYLMQWADFILRFLPAAFLSLSA
jgi:membrane protein required for colicin V production